MKRLAVLKENGIMAHMDTQKYDSLPHRTMWSWCRKGTLLSGAASILLLCVPPQAQATVAPLDDSGLGNYALVASPYNGNMNIGKTTVIGNTGFVGVWTLNNANNDTFSGNVGYSTSSFSINGGQTTVSGQKIQDSSLTTIFSNASHFAQAMDALTPTLPAYTSNFSNGTLTSTGDVNVVDLNGGASGKITLKGSANDIFYINVSSSFNISGVKLDGVKADNVYWNVVNAQNVNLSGDLSGIFLSMNGASMSITNATVDGAVFSNALNNMNTVTITGLSGLSAGDGAAALVPETSSYAALGVFVVLLAGSSFRRWWQNRRRTEIDLALDAA